MASMILGTIGTAIGGPFGGFIGSAIGAALDAYLFAPDPPDVKGPRLEDTDAVSADPGVPIALTFGADRVGGILIHTSDLIEKKHTKEEKSGKQSYKNTTYTYSVICNFMVGEGPILGIGRIWADGKIFRSFREDFAADVSANQYNVGGYPYPSWFRTAGRMYDPTELPWHLDPSLAGASADRWHIDGSGALVSGAGSGIQLTYWQDPASGYYLPLGTDVAYQGGVKIKDDDDRRGWSDYYNLFAALNDWSPRGVLTVQNPDDIVFYRGTADQPSDAIMSDLAGTDVPGYRYRAHIVFDNLQLEDFGNRVPNFTFEVVRFENETPTTILVDLMGRAGVSTDYYDLTALPSTGLKSFVPGYTIVSRTTLRKAIEALLEAFELDAAEIGEQVIFRPRDRVAEHVIPWEDLAAHEADARQTTEQLTLLSKDKLILPRVIEAAFKDVERDYQDNTKRYSLKQTTNDQNSTADLAMVLYPKFVKRWAQSRMQYIWNGQRTVEFNLPPKYVYVSASDVILVVTDKVIGTQGGTNIVASFTVKVTQVRRGANGIISVTGVLTLGALYPADDYDDFETENNYTSYTLYKELGLTELAFLDIPPLTTSALSTYGVYVAMADINSADWSGADLLQSTNGGSTYNVVATSSVVAAIGTITTGSMTAGTDGEVDDTQSFVVTITSGSKIIPSTSVPNMNLFQTLALIDGEIVSLSTVTNLGSRQFQISGDMIRGLKDTSASSHANGSSFVLLDSALVSFTAELSNAGTALDYKPVTIGLSEAVTPNEVFTHNKARLKPFKPREVSGSRDGSDNLTITWVRQDRSLFIPVTDSTGLMNSEIVESYEVDIYDGPTVVRTIDCSAPTCEYTAAQQTADGLTPGDPVDIRIYQMSSIVGRGNAAIETV